MKKYQTALDQNYWMTSNGMFCGLNAPKAIESNGNSEKSHSLPPYLKRKSFLMDKYPACPKNWMTSEGTLSSYFTPVEEGNGMWLDFNKNSEHTHEVAMVVSIQGVNPLTGLPCEDQYLEQYIENCPKCKTAFKPDRLCEECGFKYPKQNYICTTGTPYGRLWLDGFRSISGVVRQYIISAEKMRGVASNILGEDRVFAIGISFFLSKEKKAVPEQRLSVTRGVNTTLNWQPVAYNWSNNCTDGIINSDLKGATTQVTYGSAILNRRKGSSGTLKSKKRSKKAASAEVQEVQSFLSLTNNDPDMSIACNYATTDDSLVRGISPISTKSLEVAAGAKINQSVYDDPEQLDFWRDTPEATICINYCLEEEATQIIDAGEISLEGHKDGFLQDVPVGN